MVNSDDEVPTTSFNLIFDHEENDQSFNEAIKGEINEIDANQVCRISPLVVNSPRPRRLAFDSDELLSV